MVALIALALSPALRVTGQKTSDITPPAPVNETKTNAVNDFNTLSVELGEMETLFRGGGKEPVTFDTEAALKKGFSEQSIKLAEAMAAFTNDLVLAAPEVDDEEAMAALEANELNGKKVDLSRAEVEVQKYPLLEAYFEQASERLNVSDEGKEQGQNGVFTDGEGPTAINISLPCLTVGCVCGDYVHPRPGRAASFVPYKVNNASATLHAWGFHPTPGHAGGGWTRPQTYKPFLCGWSTYRDHAIIRDPGRYYYNVWVQSYHGQSPDGEPNPEVWRSGPWPYLTWPAYVYWWHSTH